MPNTGGTVCAVAECKNTFLSTVGKDISFFRFPKDKKIRNIWIMKCQRKDEWNPETSRICSEHFVKEDFERDFKAELMNCAPKKKLKADVIPSQNLSTKNTTETASAIARRERAVIKTKEIERKNLLEELLTVGSAPLRSPHLVNNISFEADEPIISDARADDDCKSVGANISSSIVGANKPTSVDIAVQTNPNEELNYKTLYNELLRSMATKENELEKKEESKKKVENILQKVLTPNQIKILSGDRKQVRWTNDEIAKAITLRYLSRRGFIFVRNEMNIPQPGLSTLRRWCSKMDMRNGIFEEVFNMLKITGQEKQVFEKLCVLCFDEVKVRETLEYDTKADEFIGPFKQMQAVMVRGLCSPWKQILFADFDRKMTADLLIGIIKRLHFVGYPVVACTCDCGGGNVGLWGQEQLNITLDNPVFPHPITNEPIVFLPDVPHLLKLLRNWFLDCGFILEDGSHVCKEPLNALLQLRNSVEVTTAHKLSLRHLDCQGTERQNVKLAAQLVSNSVGTALIRYKPGSKPEDAVNTGNFLKLMNSWFDLMNVYQPKYSAPSLSAYGLFREEQDELLSKVRQTIRSMKIPGKKGLQLFQKGIIMTTNALPRLLDNLKNYGVRYILTHRLNQDLLENLFSQLRGKGGLNDKPTPLDALYRLRLIMLGKNQGIVQVGANTTIPVDCPEEKFLSCDFMARAQIEPDMLVVQEPNQDSDFTAFAVDVENVLTDMTSLLSINRVDSDSSETDTASERGGTSTSDSSASMSQAPAGMEMPNDGIAYLAGWLAFKYRTKYPNLSSPRHTLGDHNNYTLPEWIQQLSYGGLTIPTDEFLTIVKKMNWLLEEKLVKPKGELPKGKGVVQKLVKKLIKRDKMISIPKEVVERFVRVRLIIRMRYILCRGREFAKKRRMTAALEKFSKKMKLSM